MKVLVSFGEFFVSFSVLKIITLRVNPWLFSVKIRVPQNDPEGIPWQDQRLATRPKRNTLGSAKQRNKIGKYCVNMKYAT